MKLRHTYTCPLELVHDMIKGKWKPIILWRLRLGKTSLAQLERDIEGITQKMLLECCKGGIRWLSLKNRILFDPSPGRSNSGGLKNHAANRHRLYAASRYGRSAAPAGPALTDTHKKVGNLLFGKLLL